MAENQVAGTLSKCIQTCTLPAIVLVSLLVGCAVGDIGKERLAGVGSCPPPSEEWSAWVTDLPPASSLAYPQGFSAKTSPPLEVSSGTGVELAVLPGYVGDAAVHLEWSGEHGHVVKVSGSEPGDAYAVGDKVEPDQSGESLVPLPLDVNITGSSQAELNPPDVVPSPDGLPPVTLHLDDVDVRKVLEMLSRDGGANILVSPGVTGQVTANLEGMDFHQAMGAILKLCNLVAHTEEGLIFVYTPEEFAALEGKGQELITRVYHLSYVRASDIQEMLTPFLSLDVGKLSVTPASDVGIASDTDQVGGDSLAGGEVLIIQDTEATIKMIDDIITRVDVRPTQVVIEAVIMEAILEDGMKLGVNFSVLDGAGKAVTVLGSGAAINAAAGFTPAGLLTAAAGLIDDKYPEGAVPSPNDQSIQSGGALRKGYANNDNGLKFGFVDDNVTGFIDALEQAGDINVLASPRIMVLNKQRAELIVGEKLGFLTMTVTQTSSMQNFEQEEVGTQLRLRPFVSPDGMIRMEIHPERSSGTLINGVPQTRTSEVTTNVIVPNGATIVIAGLIEEEEVVATDGIPVLSRLPLIGALFRHKSVTTVKKELIVLLTPRIWDPDEECLSDLPGTCLQHEKIDVWQ